MPARRPLTEVGKRLTRPFGPPKNRCRLTWKSRSGPCRSPDFQPQWEGHRRAQRGYNESSVGTVGGAEPLRDSSRTCHQLELANEKFGDRIERSVLQRPDSMRSRLRTQIDR